MQVAPHLLQFQMNFRRVDFCGRSNSGEPEEKPIGDLVSKETVCCVGGKVKH